MAVTVCPHCGTANRAGSNFCNSCGTDLRRAGRDAAPPQERAARPSSPESTSEPASSTSPTAEPTKPEEQSTDEPQADMSSLVDSMLPEQPWLRIEFEAENDLDVDVDPDTESDTASQDRLITGLQGLLEPVRVSSRRQGEQTDDTGGTDGTEDADAQDTEPGGVSLLESQSYLPALHNLMPDRQRSLRRLMSERPIVRNSGQRPSKMWSPRVPWIILVLGLAVAIPAFMHISYPPSTPMLWSGVLDAYLAIEDLPEEAPVLIYWAYDPATAGELDLLALAVAGHLLDRRASTMIVTPLPLGAPTARRLREQARTQQGRYNDLGLIADLTWEPPIQFLPGGVAVLPLVGLSLERVLSSPLVPPTPELRFALDQPVALHVVLAARAEHVQDWLEQVQPFTDAPLIAVTSAAADPVLRPYLDSGQLLGLVSGFDGATWYQELIDQEYRRNDAVLFQRRTLLQSWGHMAILVIIVVGNIVGLLRPQ